MLQDDANDAWVGDAEFGSWSEFPMFGLPPSEPVRQTRADSSAASGTDATRAPAEARHRLDDRAITP
jgi:hypothetical protein